jgi:hypothetical protein
MSANAFVGRVNPPGEVDLIFAMGHVKGIWDKLLALLATECGATVQEWRCYSPKMGWSLRARRKKRTIVWLSPSQECFNVAFILGKSAMDAARETKLPQRVRQALNEAPRYPEGWGVRLRVRCPRDLVSLKKLASLKLKY